MSNNNFVSHSDDNSFVNVESELFHINQFPFIPETRDNFFPINPLSESNPSINFSNFTFTDNRETRDTNENKFITTKRGRKPKNKSNISNNNESKHNKNSKDNIVKRIKNKFYDSIIKYVNKEYKNYQKKRFGRKNPKILLKKISLKVKENLSQTQNKNWLNSKIKDMLSAEISSKYSSYYDDYNKKQIERIYKENKASEIIKILEMDVKIMYDYFISDEKILDGFKTFNDYLDEMREKENEEYCSQLKKQANKLEDYFNKKKQRKKKEINK